MYTLHEALQIAWEWPRFILAAGEEYYRTGLVSLPPSWHTTRRQNPYPFYAKLRDRAPVHRSSCACGVILSRAEDVEWGLTEDRLSADQSHLKPTATQAERSRAAENSASSSATCGDSAPIGPPGPILLADDAEHGRNRNPLRTALDGQHREALFVTFAQRIEERLHKLPKSGACELMQDFVFPLMRDLTLELIGIPARRRADVHRLMRHGLVFSWSQSEALFRFPALLSREFSGGRALRGEVRRTFLSLLEENDVADGHGLLAQLLRGTRYSGLPAVEAAVLAEEVMVASFEPPACMLGNTLLALAQHPDIYDCLRQSPSKIHDALREFQRYDPAVQAVVRYAREDIKLHDESIREGEPVVLLIGSANRDPRVFREPDELQLDRRERQQFTFGKGAHACLGIHLARMVHETVLKELLARYRSMRLARQPVWGSSLPLRGLQTLTVELR